MNNKDNAGTAGACGIDCTLGRGLILALSPASFLALPLSGGDKHRCFFVSFFRDDAAAGIRCASKKSVSDSDT